METRVSLRYPVSHCSSSIPVHEVETNLSDENLDEGRVIEHIDLAEELRDRVQMDIADIYNNEKIEKINDLVYEVFLIP